MATAIIALATRDFDPTEAAVPWRVLTEAGHEVRFATADGAPGAADSDMLDGVLFGQIKALPQHAQDYAAMAASPAFSTPIRYADLDPAVHDLLVLPGGHAQGMRQYLEDPDLQAAVARFFRIDAPVGAICHGTIVLARSNHPDTGAPVIAGRTLTGLPKRFEMGAWILTKPTRGDYFRTYPEWVQDEVKQALGPDGSWQPGPFLPLHGEGFVVVDRNLVTARWPGDAERFSAALVELLDQRTP